MNEKFSFETEYDADEHSIEKSEKISNTEEEAKGAPQNYVLRLQESLEEIASFFKEHLLNIAAEEVPMDSQDTLKQLLTDKQCIDAWGVPKCRLTDVPFRHPSS